MDIVQKLIRFGGVSTRGALVRAASRAEFNEAVRCGAIVKDAHGRYALPIADVALRAANRLTGTVSHRSAAMHWGWEVKTVPERPDVTIGRKRHLAPHQADGVDLHWYDVPQDAIVGLVTSREQTLVDCMRALPFDEALAIADSALRHRSITKVRLLELADAIKGPGAPQARRVAREATHLAANPFESALRAIGLEVHGLQLEPQVVIPHQGGRSRADLVDRKRRWVVEAESHSWHSRRGDLRRDCRRYTRLVLLGFRVLRFAWEDVMFHPDYVRECLETAGSADQQARCACARPLAA